MIDKLLEMREWCEKNIGQCQRNWELRSHNDTQFNSDFFYSTTIKVEHIPNWLVGYRFSFKKEDDYTLFLMTWG